MSSGAIATHNGRVRISTVNISAPDVPALVAFYRDLLGYEVVAEEGEWALLRDPAGSAVAVAVQAEENYQRPVWPSRAGEPDMKLHLEIQVDDLETAVARAVACGAEIAGFQPQPDVRVCLDPAGHPFCLWVAT